MEPLNSINAGQTALGLTLALDGLADVLAVLEPGLAMLDRAVAASGLSLPALTALGNQLSTHVSFTAPAEATTQSADWSRAAEWTEPEQARKADASARIHSVTGELRARPAPQIAAAQRKPVATNAESGRPLSAGTQTDRLQATISASRPETVPTDTTAILPGSAAIVRPAFEAGSHAVSRAEPGHYTVSLVGVVPDLPQPVSQPPVGPPAVPPSASAADASSSVPPLLQHVQPAEKTAFTRSYWAHSADLSPVAPAMPHQAPAQQTWGEMFPGDDLGEGGQTSAVPEHAAPVPNTPWIGPPRRTALSSAIASDGTVAQDEMGASRAHTADPEPDVADRQPTETAQESLQGAIMLDGVQISRWVVEQLEHRVSRPGTMITGIDPRITATYPGAPTGA